MLTLPGRTLASTPPKHRHAAHTRKASADKTELSLQIWPLMPDWAAIVPATLALCPVTIRAGDVVCRLVCRGLWLPTGIDGSYRSTTGTRLRIDTAQWTCGLATHTKLNDGQTRRGLSFFDSRGSVVLQLDLESSASLDGFYAIVRRFSLGIQPSQVSDASLLASFAGRGDTHAADICGKEGAIRDVVFQPNGLAQLYEMDRAEPLCRGDFVEVLNQATRARLAMAAQFIGHGVRLECNSALKVLGDAAARFIGCGPDVQFVPGDAHLGGDAWLIREPTSGGVRQSLALAAPDGTLRLLLRPADAETRPQPCAWHSAISVACGGHNGSAC